MNDSFSPFLPDPSDRSEPIRRFVPPAVEVWRLDLSGHRRTAAPAVNLDPIIARLELVVRDYLRTSVRVGRPLGTECLRKVLLALRIESRGGKGRAALAGGGRIATFLRESLFDELMEQAGAVRIRTEREDGCSDVLPLDAETWRRCLDELESRYVEVG